MTQAERIKKAVGKFGATAKAFGLVDEVFEKRPAPADEEASKAA